MRLQAIIACYNKQCFSLKIMAVIISDELLASTHLDEQEIRIELAIWLYQTHKISMGKAAEVAGTPKFAFQRLLAERQIPVSYGPDDLAQDLETLQHFGR